MSKDEKPKKTRVDQELESEMGYFKEPIVRLQQVEDSAAQAINSGDLERALFLRMQVSTHISLCTSVRIQMCMISSTIASRRCGVNVFWIYSAWCQYI